VVIDEVVVAEPVFDVEVGVAVELEVDGDEPPDVARAKPN
jgi:hypothetical protein